MFSYKLLDGFNKGERKAQNLVWKKYFPEVFSNIRILTGGSLEAEDMALEIMEKLILQGKTFERCLRSGWCRISGRRKSCILGETIQTRSGNV